MSTALVNTNDIQISHRRRLFCRCFFYLSLFCSLFCGSLTCMAQEVASNTNLPQDIQRELQDISDTVMSPFCPGRTLSACPSAQARKLRGDVEQWLKEGATIEEVKARLIVIYGDEVLGAPRASGVGWFAWLTPAAFILLGALFLVLAIRKLRKTAVLAEQGTGDASSAANVSDAAVLKELELEVQRRLQ